MKEILTTFMFENVSKELTHDVSLVAKALCLRPEDLYRYLTDKPQVISLHEALCAKVFLALVTKYGQRITKKLVFSYATTIRMKDGSLLSINWNRHYRELMERLGEPYEPIGPR